MVSLGGNYLGPRGGGEKRDGKKGSQGNEED